MDRFRALLLGVAQYDHPNIDDLPFVGTDLIEVATALESRGCTVAIPDESVRLGRTRILTEVSRFLESARPRDTVIVYLSGHGTHTEHADYLVPSDADPGWWQLSEVCVPLDAWGPGIENCAARGIVFLVDACREGFQENTKAVTSRTLWQPEKVARAARRNVAWVFPCSPGQVSRFVRGDEVSFSLFSRAVARSVTDPSVPTTLTEFHRVLADRLTELAAEHRLPEQQVRVAGEADHAVFTVLPGTTGGDAAGTWANGAAEHVAWRISGAGKALKDPVVDFVRRLALARNESRTRLARDPWQDPGFALRMTERVEFLVGSVLGDLDLTPAEAALLVALPFVHDGHWSETAAAMAEVGPEDLMPRTNAGAERAEFEAYTRGHPRLLRRALSGRLPGAGTQAEIGWWFLHHWTAGRPGAYQMSPRLLALFPEDGLAQEVLSPERLSELIKVLRFDRGFIASTDRPLGLSAEVTVAPGRIGEQRVRERLLGYILAVAYRMAIDPLWLPDVIADHIGIADSVDPAGLRETLAGAVWEPRGGGRTLRAACAHQAVEMALREHVTEFNLLLADVQAADDPSLAALKGLPNQVDADRLHAVIVDGEAAYDLASVRFRLAEDRVQELLMGEQLYGEGELAIREIYQNALDACRYRRARTEYLTRTDTDLPPWEGRIRFTQGIDRAGRAYIECADNGIGMAARELRDVFAQAGSRFVELPEFLEERAAWAELDPPVELHPNSRFGIGVLSYFMLADEITVETCRLSLNGRPGDRYRVVIAGPGTLFRIKNLGPGTDAGTTIRLHLRPSGEKGTVSCVTTLRDVLWVSEFPVEASDGVQQESWKPGELRKLPYHRALQQTPGIPVWWTDSESGMVLVDGLTTNNNRFGVIVNMSGENHAQLSVDRKELLKSEHNRQVITRLLAQAAASLAGKEHPFLTFDWLTEFSREEPVVADLIFSGILQRKETRLEINGKPFDMARLGFFPPDRDFIAPAPGYSLPLYSRNKEAQRTRRRADGPLTDELARWRIRLLSSIEQAADCVPPDQVMTRPSDWTILLRRVNLESPVYSEETGEVWLRQGTPVTTRHIIAAAQQTGYPIGVVARRLDELGYPCPEILLDVEGTEPFDLTLISRILDPNFNLLRPLYWYSVEAPIPPGHLLAAAEKTGQPVGNLALRMARLGFTVPGRLLDMAEFPSTDLIITSRDLDGQSPWLAIENEDGPATVPGGHVTSAAVAVNQSPREIAQRLRSLGFHVPGPLSHRAEVSTHARMLISKSVDGNPPLLTGSLPVHPAQVLALSRELDSPVHEVARELSDLGYDVPAAVSTLTESDRRFLSYTDTDDREVRPSYGLFPVQLKDVVMTAEQAGAAIGAVALSWRDLGFQVNAEWTTLGSPEPTDQEILRRDPEDDFWWLPMRDDDEMPLPVAAGHVIRAATRTGRTIGETAARLVEFGLQLQPGLLSVGHPEPFDLVLASVYLTGGAPWLGSATVPLGHLLAAATRLGLPPSVLAARMNTLGFPIPPNVPDDWDMSDLALLNTYLRGWIQDENDLPHGCTSLWISQDHPVPIWQIIAASVRLNRPVEAIAQRFNQLGLQVPKLDVLYSPVG